MLPFKKFLPTIAAAMLIGAAAARAENYPTRPITAIVPFAGGSASDVVSRILFDRMSKSLGQPIVVENRPGAGGNSGTADAAKAAPDGYTIVGGGSGPVAANVTLYKHLDYDPQKDLVTISPFASFTIVVVASAKLPVNNLQELIAYAKAHPGELNYGSVGIGSSQHLAGEFFAQLTGAKITHVPYRNIGQYMPDLMSGQVPLGFQWYPNISAALAAKGARALAVAGGNRLDALPDVPTTKEAGLVCATGAASYPAGDRCQAQQRAEGCGRGSRGACAVCPAGRRGHLHDAGSVQEISRRRDREVSRYHHQSGNRAD
jgi:tripartite-type tricarboxylate transporter receptor subunit TctC